MHGRGGRALHALARHASLRKFQRCFLAAAAPPAPAFLQSVRLLPLGRRSGRRNFRSGESPGAAGRVGPGIARLLRGQAFASRFYRAARNHCRAAIFPSSHFPICSSRFARTRPCTGTRPGTMCSLTAAIRRIRWGAWCSICAAIATRSGSGFPTRRARRCSSRISGRTSRATSKRAASTFRWRRSPRTASRKTTSCERRFDARYVSLMKELIARTRQLFAEGMPLARSVDSALRVDIEMFSRGGLAVLDAIEAIGYNTLEHRPSIPKSKQLSIAGARARPARCFTRAVARPLSRRSRRLQGSWRLSRAAASNPDIRKMRKRHGSEVAQSYAECRRVARARASNFYYAFFMLPQAKRDALCALYAFMRLVDDVSDTVGSAGGQAARPGALARRAGCSGRRATFRAIRFFPRLPTRSSASTFRRATSTI